MSCRRTILENYPQCLLLNKLINAAREIFQFLRNENTKNEHAESKERKFE